MMKKPFFGLSKPRVLYPPSQEVFPAPRSITPPSQVTLLIEGALSSVDTDVLKKGAAVKTGQKIQLSKTAAAYTISSATGTVTELSPYEGDFGKTFVAVTVDVEKTEQFDESFAALAGEPTLETAQAFLQAVPGAPRLLALSNAEKPIDTIVVTAEDQDMLVATNRFAATNKAEALKKGVSLLKQISGVDRVILAIPRDRIQNIGHIEAELKAVDTAYPSANPLNIMHRVLKKTVPAGKSPEDMGVVFFSAEAVAAIGEAFETGRVPVNKIVTLIHKDGSQSLLEVRIGTPIRTLIAACQESLTEMDRLINGGPMTGRALYTENHPVGPDTDAIMLQDKADVPLVSDYPCVNCGQCVRVCPANIPVNMLVRFLEAGSYQAGADEYDLYSCIECGLCSYVCIAKIPIFQYIRLAKYELSRVQTAEANND
jgi:electron transport complex protein RnfC